MTKRIFELSEGKRFRYKGNIYIRGERISGRGAMYMCKNVTLDGKPLFGRPFNGNLEVETVDDGR